MSSVETAPVKDSVAKIGNELAVGEDLEFQRRWWSFERFAWVMFLVIVLLDVAGVFGRGPAAKAHANSRGGAMVVDYERVERFSTPSILTIHFGPSAVHDGKIQLWVSDTVIKELGNQRVTPQPSASVIGNGGILYTFLTTDKPDSVEFALEPSRPGVSRFELRMPQAVAGDHPEAGLSEQPQDEFEAKVFVMP